MVSLKMGNTSTDSKFTSDSCLVEHSQIPNSILSLSLFVKSRSENCLVVHPSAFLEFWTFVTLYIVELVLLSNIESLKVTSSAINSHNISFRGPFQASCHIFNMHKRGNIVLFLYIPHSDSVVHRRGSQHTINSVMPLRRENLFVVPHKFGILSH